MARATAEGSPNALGAVVLGVARHRAGSHEAGIARRRAEVPNLSVPGTVGTCLHRSINEGPRCGWARRAYA